MDAYLGKDHKTETLAMCPCCKAQPMDSSFHISSDESIPDIPPRDGDMSICAYCGAVLAYVDDGACLGLRKASGEQLAKLRKNKPLWRVMRKVIQSIWERMK